MRSQKKKSKRRRLKLKKKSNSYSLRELANLSFDSKLLNRIRENANFFIDAEEDNDLKSVRAINSYVELATMITMAATTPGIYLTLCWPIGFEWVGLAHFLASRTIASNSLGESGLRMALYPALHSNYGRYRRTRIPMQSFLDEARCVANSIGKNLSPRHLAYMRLNDLENDKDPRKHPAIANALSIFEWEPNIQDWSLYGKGYFSDVRIALHHHAGKTRHQKKQIEKYAAIMADPAQAKEAVFRLKRKTKPNSARKILIKNEQAFDLIMIDARQNLLKGTVSSQNALLKLIEQGAKKESVPSIVLLIDNPGTYQFFSNKLLKLARTNKVLLPKRFFHYEWLRHTDTLWLQKEASALCITPWPKIDICVSDAQSLFDINKINNIAGSINDSNPDMAYELRCAGGFLRRLVNMPVGQKAIEEWLVKTTAKWPESSATLLASRYTWRHYRINMHNRISARASKDPAILDRFSKIADALVSRIMNFTSIETETINFVKDSVTNSKQILILVEDRKYIELMEASLRRHVSESVMNFVKIKTDIHPKYYSKYDKLIVAGTGKNRISTLLFTNQLPDHIALLFDAYSAQGMLRDLSCLRNISAFAPIHSRIDTLLALTEPQIESFKLGGSIFELPTELHSQAQPHEYEYNLSAPYAMLHLSGYGILPVGEMSSLIKVNPEKHPPFRAITVENVTEGDCLLVPGDEDRDKISELLKIQGGRLTSDAEQLLTVYFKIAHDKIRQNFPQNHRTQRARALISKMRQIDPDVVKNIHESMVIRWTKHIDEFDFETCNMQGCEFKTNSPRRKKHFLLFAEALGFDSFSMQQYWDRGIYQLRIGRILEGRKLSNRLKSILIGAIEITSLHMKQEEVNELFMIANECTYPVEMILFKDDIDEDRTCLIE